MNIEEYLAAHDNRQPRNGKSGAAVWDIENRYVLKYVQRAELQNPEVFTLYRNEAYFYQFYLQPPMEKYCPVCPRCWMYKFPARKS